MKDFIGSPPYCRPECVSNSECAGNKACINQKCQDPCAASICATNAECHVINHTPMCVCAPGYSGDPFSYCDIIRADVPETLNPCQPSPCGSNAHCSERNGAGACQCLPDYFGNPYEGCRLECILNSDCPANKACMQNKCKDPCPGICGQNAECHVLNHLPSCLCYISYTGDPYKYCSPIIQRKDN